VCRLWGTNNAHRILVGNPLGGLKRNWEYNMKIDLRQVCCEIGLADDHVLWYTFIFAVLNFMV
jgi:hypothetical protein